MRVTTLMKIVGALLLAANFAQAQDVPARIRLGTEDIVVSADGSFVNTTHIELQVLTAAIASQAMQQRVSYEGTLEDVEIIEAFTVKPNGQKIAVDPSSIFTQQAQATGNSLTPIYTNRQQKVIVFPNVEAGDTLSYTVRHTQNPPLWPGQYFLADNYLGTVALDESRVTVTAPKTMPLQVDANGVDVKKSDRGDQTVYSWSYAHPTPEPAQVQAVNDPRSRPHVYLSSFKSYDDVARSYAAMTRGKIAVTPAIQAEADQLTGGITDKRAQAQAIYGWVAQRVRYVAINFGLGRIVPHDGDWVLNNMYGDCKDHALLFASLLKAKGIAADLVIVNASNDYGISKVPEISSFNHMIVWLPDFKFYADTTASSNAFGTLPLVEYGKPVVHMIASGPAQAQIPLLGKDMSITYKVTETMDDAGRLDVTAVTTATGPMAASLRRLASAIQTIGPEKAAGNLLTKNGMPRATGTFTVSPPALTTQYQLTGTFKTGGAAINQFFWGAANGLRALNGPGDFLMGPLNNMANNVKLSDTDPTPCYSGRITDDVSLQMLPGKQMVSIPADVSIKTAHLRYTTQWTHSGSNITVHREFVADMDQPTCSGSTRKEAADALARIKADIDTRMTLAPGGAASDSASGEPSSGGPATTVSFALDDTKVAPAGPDTAGVSPTVQSALPTAPDAPHIDALTLSPGSRDGLPSVVQQIFYRAPKGNAVTMHFEVVSISSPAPDFGASDIRIGAPAERQQAGTYMVVNSGCGRFPGRYSVVKRAVLIDADGKHSNAIDYSIKCNSAATSASQ